MRRIGLSVLFGVGLLVVALGLLAPRPAGACATDHATVEGGTDPRAAAQPWENSPALQETPPLTPTPTVDLYNLPGDYGEVGRLFDFAVMMAIVQGFLDIIGVSNLRDFIAIGAALAIIVNAVVRPTSTTE